MTRSLAQSIGPGHTPSDWAKSFLQGLGAPTTPGNVNLVVDWENRESGGGGGLYNPLNSVLPTPNSSPANSAGVQNYTSYEEGLAASVATFSQTQWAAVVQALRANDQGGAIVAIEQEYQGWDPNFTLTGAPPQGVLNEPGASGGGATSTGAASSGSAGFYGCPEGKVFDGPSILGARIYLTKCEGRALLGAISIAGGGLLMLVGLGFVAVGSSRVGKLISA